MKKKRGRKQGTGVYSGIKPSSQTWSDIRNTIIYGSPEWRIIVLQETCQRVESNFARSRRTLD